jgi:hypothetical protein
MIAPWQRWGLIVSAIVVAVTLGIAAWLTPSEQGLGTHQQLGLPPCTLRILAGIRCPSCGMTTSWSYMMHGQVLRSFQTNVGGALLALSALTYVPWASLSAYRGRWWLATPDEWVLAISSLAVLLVTISEWGLRVYWEWKS